MNNSNPEWESATFLADQSPNWLNTGSSQAISIETPVSYQSSSSLLSPPLNEPGNNNEKEISRSPIERKPFPIYTKIPFTSTQEFEIQPEEYRTRWQSFVAKISTPWRKIIRAKSNSWAVEIASLMLSIGLLIFLLLLLARFDEHVNPQWRHLTLNGLLSVCIAVSVAAIVLPICSGLGQLKWIRAERGSVRLQEFDVIDKATRGPWGSLGLCARREGGALAFVGALAATLSFAAAPFAQQAVWISTELTGNLPGEALVHFCQSDNGSYGQGYVTPTGAPQTNKSILQTFPFQFRAATYTAFYGQYDSSKYSDDLIHCSSGTCSWDPFPTLGVTSQCDNVKVQEIPFIPNGSDTTVYSGSIPGGAYLDASPVSGTQFSMLPSQSMDFLVTNTSNFLSFTAISISNSSDTGDLYLGWNCTLGFAVQIISTSITNGTLTENITETFTESSWSTQHITNNNETRRINVFRPPDNLNSPFNATITVDAMDLYWFNRFYSNIFNGVLGDGIEAPSDASVALGKDPLQLPERIENLAGALSRELRQSCSGRASAPGTAWNAESIVHIRWRWLTLPAIVEILGTVFFVAVVFLSHSSDAELWKTSILAAVFHAPDIDRENRRINTVYEMEKKAAKMKVRLESKDKSGVTRLVQSRNEGNR